MDFSAIDSFKRRMGDLDVRAGHAQRLIQRARAKGLAVEIRD